jgi:two-component system, NarL family, sensor kinase
MTPGCIAPALCKHSCVRNRGRRSSAGHEPAPSVARAVAQFAITGTLAVAALGWLSVQILQRTGRSEAIRDARDETVLAGHGIVAPRVNAGVLAGDRASIATLDRVVRGQVLKGAVIRVKIWDSHGTIVYSDEPRLIGSTYPLGVDERAALRTGAPDVGISDLTKPENRFERPQRKVLEVYLGIAAAGGRRLLYEEYLAYSSVAASGRRLWSSFAPAMIATLITLELAQIPLAWSLARRLRRRHEERVELLRRAIDASELERQRIAHDLHDGVVQNLAGVSYSLSAAAGRIREHAADQEAAMVEQAAADTRASIGELRTLLVDIYPPTLDQSGLAAAVADLSAALRRRGVAVDIEVDDLRISAEKERLLYRVAQEALRNVARHAQAHHVRVYAERLDSRATLGVEDDGRGFVVGPKAGDAGGHFGLQFLRELAADAGGELTIDSRPGAGTRIRLEVPVP